jgi:carbon starvation protein CstA
MMESTETSRADQRRHRLVSVLMALATTVIAAVVVMSVGSSPLALPEVLLLILLSIGLVRLYERRQYHPATVVLSVLVLAIAVGMASRAVVPRGGHASSKCVQNCPR